jgi:endonuclease YncB( thermonuclease family)
MARSLSLAPAFTMATLAAAAGAFALWMADAAERRGSPQGWRESPAQTRPAALETGATPAAGPRAASAGEVLPGPFAAYSLRVIDGDTFEARVQVWLGQDVTTRVRLRGFDAPETKSRCAAERAAGEDARRALADALASGALSLTDVSRDKYGGRIVASARIAREGAANGASDDLAGLMLAGGYGRAYAGGKRGPNACGE